MAINDNFVFSDPALQAQVANAAQVRAAENAARAQQFAETQRALRADRQLAADREERRAERDRIISEGQARTAESKRQFDESLKFNREDAASRTSAVTAQRKEAEQREQYAAILRAIESADGRSLPTAKELEARTADLLPQHRQLLQEARGRRAAQLTSDFGLIAAEADRLNALIGTDSGDGKKWTVDRLLRGSQFKSNLIIGPDGRIQSLAIRPRDDILAPSRSEGVFPQPSLGFVPRDTDFRVPQIAGTGPSPVEPVANVLNAISQRSGSIAATPSAPSPASSPGFFVPTGGPPESIFQSADGPAFMAPLAATQMPFEGRMPFRVPDSGPSLIPAEAFDMPAGGFTGGEKLMQRGMRLIEAPRDAALRRLFEARKTYPEAELVERPDGVFISPTPRTMFRAPIPGASDLLAAPVFAPSY